MAILVIEQRWDCVFGAGIGTEVDIVQSQKFHKAAAEAGDEPALYSYWQCVLSGIGVERNDAVGVELLEIAISAGSMGALLELGKCYYSGRGVEKIGRKHSACMAKLRIKGN